MQFGSANNSTKKFLILGSGLEAWVCALWISKHAKALNISVDVIELKNSINSPVEEFVEHFSDLHDQYGINQKELLRCDSIGFFYGWEHQNGHFENCFIPIGEYGFQFNRIPFYQCFSGKVKELQGLNIDDYSIAKIAAAKRKFLPAEIVPNNLSASLKSGLVVDSKSYEIELKNLALKEGVSLHSVSSVEVRYDEEGNARSLRVDSGLEVEADFFIDFTGSISNVVLKENAEPRINNRQHFLVFNEEAKPSLQVEVIADEMGVWKIYQRTNKIIVIFWGSNEWNESEITESAKRKINSCCEPTEISSSPFYDEWKRECWVKNTLTLGAAVWGGVFTPRLDLLISAMQFLLHCFPAGSGLSSREEFNRMLQQECEHYKIIDEIIRHCYLPPANVLHIGSAELSSTTRRVIDLFSSQGYLPDQGQNSFWKAGIAIRLLGFGVIPGAMPREVGAVNTKEWCEMCTGFSRLISEFETRMPILEEFLDYYLKRG